MSEEEEKTPAAEGEEAAEAPPAGDGEAAEEAEAEAEAEVEGTEEDGGTAPTEEGEQGGEQEPQPGKVDAEILRVEFEAAAEGGGVVPKDLVGSILDKVGVEVPGNLDELIKEAQLEPEAPTCTFPEVCSLVGIIQQGVEGEGTSSMRRSQRGLNGSNRHYLENGHLTEDQTVLDFMKTLDAHKRRCEEQGKYKEATMAAQRLNELKLHEEAKLRMQMGSRQVGERGDAESAYQQESEQHAQMWQEKFQSYEDSVREQVERLRDIHIQKMEGFRERCEFGRPPNVRPSKELLNQREIQRHLAKQGQYEKAEKIKRVADRMEAAEFEATQQAYANECMLKEQRLRHQQGQEMEALLQRANRGRDELRITYQQDAERRAQRYRNVMQELENIQRLEEVQLEYFLEQQTIAGKRELLPPPPPPPKTSQSSRGLGSLRPSTSTVKT